MASVKALLALCLVSTCLVLSNCAYPVRNQEASTVNDFDGYRWRNLKPTIPGDTLVIVTASGGGTRATALALSALKGLDNVVLPDGRRLSEKVDVISGVSGGSVTAAYFALRGRDGFDKLEKEFVRHDGMAALFGEVANPFRLFELATNGEERIDLLIDYLDDRLFDGASFETLLDAGTRPLLLLNAADMVEGIPFTFTERKFGLLCSDLTQMNLATAVAASAAFPVALSPVTLTNYQPCPAIAGKRWPPNWVRASLDKQDAAFEVPSKWYDSPERSSLARAEYAYAEGAGATSSPHKRYIHLLDGGIADNLGVFEPLRMLITDDTDPSFLRDFDSGQITKLIFVVVNARSFASSELDESPATPGMLDMLLASVNAPIDRATAGTAIHLRKLLLEEFRQVELDDPTHAARFHALAENTALISIDFDAIADDACRRKFHSIPTSWTLKEQEIDAVLLVGAALLGNDPSFAKLLEVTGARQPNLPSLKDACAAL